MKKFLVKLNLSRKSVATKIETGRHYLQEMTGNPNFTIPVPALSSVKTAIDELEQANNDSLDGGKSLKAILHSKEVVYDLKITALGDYVDNTALGSETIIKSAGMETRAIPAPIGLPGQVINLLLILGEVSGEVRLRWKSVKGAKVYFVFMSPDADNDATYELVATPTAARVIVKDLTPGKIYWFKVKAVGAAGAGQLSDPGKIRVV